MKGSTYLNRIDNPFKVHHLIKQDNRKWSIPMFIHVATAYEDAARNKLLARLYWESTLRSLKQTDALDAHESATIEILRLSDEDKEAFFNHYKTPGVVVDLKITVDDHDAITGWEINYGDAALASGKTTLGALVSSIALDSYTTEVLCDIWTVDDVRQVFGDSMTWERAREIFEEAARLYKVDPTVGLSNEFFEQIERDTRPVPTAGY